MTQPCFLSAGEAADAILAGGLTSEALVASCLDRIAAREPYVRAWAYLDPAAALAEARARDREAPRGRLHGIPFGVKDVIDTADMPTEFGARAFAGRRPSRDAAGVALLRAAGAVILGKTVTAELANYHPGATINPRRTGHTPGGSSSGSAAAVADCHVPIALGTQTAGSIIRPACFCGVFGLKPSFNRYPSAGMLETAAHLDTLGGFARTTDDLLLMDAVLAGDHAVQTPSWPLVIALCRGPVWNEASASVRDALAETAEALAHSGATIIERELPAPFDPLPAAQAVIHKREVWANLDYVRRDCPDGLSDEFKAFLDEGAGITEADYKAALATQRVCKAAAIGAFAGLDLVLTPGAKGMAPAGLGATGDPVFSRLWTAAGLPCLGFPAVWKRDLPVGLQFVGPPRGDRAMLRNAGGLLTTIGLVARITTPHDLHLTESIDGTNPPRALFG